MSICLYDPCSWLLANQRPTILNLWLPNLVHNITTSHCKRRYSVSVTRVSLKPECE